MEKFFPPKPPVELVLTPAVGKLLTLFAQNGFHNIALALIVHDMDTTETSVAGNLNDVGMHALLSSAAAKVADPQSASNEEKL